MAKKKNTQNSPIGGKISSNGTAKAMTEAEKAGVKPISAWSWFFKNFGLISVACFTILPFGAVKSWGTSVVWVPIGFFVVIAGVSIYHGIKMYRNLVKNGYIKRFGEK
jgi:hypothetical protein